MPAAIRRFSEAHPQVRVVVDDCAPDQFVSRIIGEHVDFGIGTPERPGAEVETQTLLRDHLAWSARATIRWRRRRRRCAGPIWAATR